MADYTAHADTFARDHLPPREQWPEFRFTLPELRYPARLNCATELLDKTVASGAGERTVFVTPNETWTYRRLLETANRIAHVLTRDFGLVPGNRVLIRSANNPMTAACWFGIVKAGGIAVTTMPLLRAKELAVILEKAQIRLALCDERLGEEMERARAAANVCERICHFDGSGRPGAASELETRLAHKPTRFDDVVTSRDDVVIIAFTSGTTGEPKGTVHFHRDIMAICDCFPRSVLKPESGDLFIGSPPIGFTFGLGGLVAFPMRVGAASVLLEAAPPDRLVEAIQEFKPTICFTVPAAYRRMADHAESFDLSSLEKCVSAGETLPLPTFEAWQACTGIKIIDGIGSTEMLHIFISAPPDRIRPGATGLALPGYEARVVDDDLQPLPPGEVGHLAVRGPTGCRYLADERQREYVRGGWNITGDAYKVDEDGYFWYQARTDDMIISSGYNIAGPEVEEALLAHDAVAECAVVAAPDADRGTIVKAFVVLREGAAGSDALRKELQDFVKTTIAAYKYPRAVEFLDALPRTETGKVQRFRLRQQEGALGSGRTA
ncbi:MAG: AMP-binding protein [Gammaproteobacteria bacterium]|nr:AMP-binding protein [Gammaproteobacteria bacterium]NIR84300.1 AMP-binding protein [Gammaproteobacteria bacterium]NIR89770.1 AMP-binding protein [Gammaproteobacteria bacterium]NIU05458.1 AMP-binding protein [Gammaproteobacteria bacterium]NIV52405.1 AMP-binding protein [Gammaproteobacteria bacterium]